MKKCFRRPTVRALLLLVAVGLLARDAASAATPSKDPNSGWLTPFGSKWVLKSPAKPWSIQRVPQPSLHGEDSLRFELRKGEDWANRSGSRTFRAEVDTDEYPPMKSVRWYRLDLYLPQDFPIEDNRLVLAQWHGEDKTHLGEVGRSPVLAFGSRSGRFFITLRHSAERVVRDADAVPSKELFGTNSFPVNEWNDFVVQAKWSYEADGFINIWWQGKPVVQYRGPVGYNDDVGPYLTFGIYRDDSEKTYVTYVNQVRSGSKPEDVGFNPSVGGR